MTDEQQNVERLYVALHDENPDYAIAALGEIAARELDNPRLVTVIKSLMNDDADPRVSSSAEATLRELGYDIEDEASGLTANEVDNLSERELLIKILHTVEAQQKVVLQNKQQIGCLYAFMLLMIGLLILGFLFVTIQVLVRG